MITLKTIKITNLLFLLFLFGFITKLNAQDLTTLEKQKAQNEKDIFYTNTLIKNTLEDQKNSLNKLTILNKKIESRESLITSIESETNLLDLQITETQNEISNFENRLEKLKDHYAKSIYYAYKHKNSYQKLMFLFSSKNFNQAYKRFKYLQQYTNYINKQGSEIVIIRNSLNNSIKQLKVISKEKKSLIVQKINEKQLLSQEEDQQTQLIDKLKKKEKTLRKDLEKQRQYALELEKEIQRIIEREAKLAAKEAEKTGLILEKKLLSDNFSKNKGKLPWPTESGFISEKFGEHPHPVLKNVKIRNDGINITTIPKAACSSVFKGIVTHILSMPGLNTIVIIRHGEFFSVYSNLTNVFVKKGDNVDIKQKIGTVYTDQTEGSAILKFQLWKGNIKLNPAKWLYQN